MVLYYYFCNLNLISEDDLKISPLIPKAMELSSMKTTVKAINMSTLPPEPHFHLSKKQ